MSYKGCSRLHKMLGIKIDERNSLN